MFTDFAYVSMKEPQPEEHASFSMILIDRTVLDAHAFHVLSADVEDKINTAAEIPPPPCNAPSSRSHHRSALNAGLDQPFPVSGYASPWRYKHVLRQLAVKLTSACSMVASSGLPFIVRGNRSTADFSSSSISAALVVVRTGVDPQE